MGRFVKVTQTRTCLIEVAGADGLEAVEAAREQFGAMEGELWERWVDQVAFPGSPEMDVFWEFEEA